MESLRYYLAKLQKYSRLAAIRDSRIDKTSAVSPGCNIIEVSMGRYSYVGSDSIICNASIGNFVSIGGKCSIGGGAHPLDRVSTSPVFHKGRNILNRNFSHSEPPEALRVSVGNDVWIGDGVFIRDGVSVGDGAVIGAHAVVTRNVEPYAIVAGCPARLIRYRFDEEIVHELLKSKWWDLEERELAALSDAFDDPSLLLKKLRQKEK